MSIYSAINEQIKNEFYSSYLYLAMSAYLSDLGLPGFASWMRVQAKEELTHAEKMYDFMLARGQKVELKAIDAPKADWKSPLEVLQAGLAHEKLVTSYINNLVDIAIQEKDHAAQIFLSWFVTEQVEEEQNFVDLVNSLKLIKGEGQGLLMLDRELAGRTLADSAAPSSSPGE